MVNRRQERRRKSLNRSLARYLEKAQRPVRRVCQQFWTQESQVGPGPLGQTAVSQPLALTPPLPKLKPDFSFSEKTPMCLINELARHNKTTHQYRLIDESGSNPCLVNILTVGFDLQRAFEGWSFLLQASKSAVVQPGPWFPWQYEVIVFFSREARLNWVWALVEFLW